MFYSSILKLDFKIIGFIETSLRGPDHESPMEAQGKALFREGTARLSLREERAAPPTGESGFYRVV